MRYVLHFNPEGTQTLLSRKGDSLEFVKLPKALTNGATTKVRVSYSSDLMEYGNTISNSYVWW